MIEKFKCDGCGLCCKAVNCEHLNSDNKCTIYDSRPAMCNVDKGYEMYFKDKMSKEVWYAINYKACDDLKNNAHSKENK